MSAQEPRPVHVEITADVSGYARNMRAALAASHGDPIPELDEIEDDEEDA